MRTSATGILSDQAGFTLIELVVVVVILSLVSFVSFPLLLNRIGGDELTMVRRVAGTVKELYNEATLTRDEYHLVFDLDRNSIQSFRIRGSIDKTEKEPFRREVALDPLIIRQIDVEGQGSFRSGQVTVRIFPLGWMDQTRLFVRHSNGTEMQLLFSPLTGTATIDEAQRALP